MIVYEGEKDMKKEYVRPMMVGERFAPDEYVAACGDTEYGMYKFKCDAPAGSLYYYKQNGDAQLLGYSYHPCGNTHEAAVSSEFPDGFVDYNNNGTQDEGEAVVVWIERNRWGWVTNAHATTNINRDSWEVSKS